MSSTVDGNQDGNMCQYVGDAGDGKYMVAASSTHVDASGYVVNDLVYILYFIKKNHVTTVAK